MRRSSQRDKDFCNAGRLIKTQNDSEPLRTFVLGGFLHMSFERRLGFPFLLRSICNVRNSLKLGFIELLVRKSQGIS